MLFTTEVVVPAQRVDYWQQCLRSQLHIDCQIEPRGGQEFACSLTLTRIGSLHLGEWRGSGGVVHSREHAAADTLFVLLQLEGNSSVSYAGRQAHIEPGEFLIYPAKGPVEHEFRVADGVGVGVPPRWSSLIMQLPCSELTARWPDWRHQVATTIAGDGVAALFVDNLRSLARHAAALRSEELQQVADATMGLLAAALAERGHGDGGGDSCTARMEAYHCARIKNFVRAHLCSPDLNVAVIAQGVGLSQGHIHRLFAKEAMPLMQWVWSERLRHCYRDLASTRRRSGRSISSVAYRWGFNNAAHFSRSFRKCFGMAPREVRGQAAAPERSGRSLGDSLRPS